ncbi:MAG: hypothetical protein ACFB2Y_24810 [Fulvivirga sp.]
MTPIHKVYYLHAGLLISYSTYSNGKEHILMFAPEGWILADNTASELPASLSIDALEDPTIEVKTKILTNGITNMAKLLRRLMALQNHYVALHQCYRTLREPHFQLS